MAPGGSTCHPDQHGPRHIMALRHGHGSKWLTRHLFFTWPLVTTGAPDINSTPAAVGSQTQTCPLCSIHGPGNARTPGDSTGNSHQDVSDGSMALRCPHGSRFWPRSQMSMWPLMAACATDINTDPGCDQNTDLDMFLGISLGKDVTMFLGGYVGHKNQHGPHRKHGPGGSLDSIIMAVIDGLRSHRYQHRP